MIEANRDANISRGYTVSGRGPSQVVLLHSSMSSSRQWRDLIQMLAGERQVVAIDLLGYGSAPSPHAGAAFSLENETDRIEALLGEIFGRYRTVHLVGHSYGGAVALRIACTRPERLDSLTLFEPTAFHLLRSDDESLMAVNEVAALAIAASEVTLIAAQRHATQRFIDFWSEPGAFSSMSGAQQLSLMRLLPKVANDFRALFTETTSLRQCQEMPIRTLLISGAKSPACSHQIINLLSNVLPWREVRCVDTGHLGPMTHPSVVNPIISAFLRSAVRTAVEAGESRYET